MNETKVIAICNQKGGVGKTTTTVNLGIGLARQGKKVLVIDADPQSDLTTSLGHKDSDALETTLSTVMGRMVMDRDFDLKEGILRCEEGIDLMPSNLGLSSLEMGLVNAMGREHILRNYLGKIKDNYDYVLIDCMPSLGIVTVNALAAADSVIIPVQAQYLPAKGMSQLMNTISRVKQHINPNLKIEGVVMTLVDGRTNLAKDTERIIKNSYGPAIKIFDAKVPVAVKAAEAPIEGKSIYKMFPDSPVARAYENLTKEVLRDGDRQRERLRATDAR